MAQGCILPVAANCERLQGRKGGCLHVSGARGWERLGVLKEGMKQLILETRLALIENLVRVW